MNVSRLLDAGLRGAMAEVVRHKVGGCVKQHAQYISRGWKFCPHCAMVLHIHRICDTCGRKFLSKKSFEFHNRFGHPKPCPSCLKPSKHKMPYGTGGRNAGCLRICEKCDVVFNLLTGKRQGTGSELFEGVFDKRNARR